ncbi:MAG: hypothetical protein NXI31_05890, partial [bacterium]|nr:hypothetical protein [bacterium]
VNGDGLADAVIYFAATGDWWVALSTGGSFASPTRWAAGHGIGSHNQFLGDCNGDGKADSVIFQNQTGNWYVALARTNGFGPATLWRSNHGIGSTVQWLEDTTGDGNTDAVAYFDTTGDWWVAPATNAGTRFIVPIQYETGFGTGLNQRMGQVGHTTGADIVGIDGATGDWHVRVARGYSFQIQGTTQPFGSGCLGSAGVPTLTASTLPSQRPVPGNTFRVRLTNVPAALRFGAIGFSTTTYAGTPLPADLGTLGAPGCQLRVSIDIVTTLFTPDWDLQLTNSPVLLGFIIHQQVFQLDNGWNPLGMTLSNALRVQIGAF